MNTGNQQGARIEMLSREEAQRLGKEIGIPSTLAHSNDILRMSDWRSPSTRSANSFFKA